MSVDGKGENYERFVASAKRKCLYLSYYYKNVQFQAVHSWDLSLKKLFDFFVNNELVNRNNVLLTNVDLQNTDYYKRFPYDKKCLSKEFIIINTIIKEKFINKEELFPIELEFLTPFRVLFTDLNTRRFSIILGACLFDSRLFLDSDGNYHICEKINHKFPIGNIDKGLNYKKMVKMAKEFINLLNTKCKNCDVKYLCRRCYVLFGKDGRFEIDEDYCRFSRNLIINSLEDLIRNKEAGMSTF
jgi:uncharacterized protein